MTNMVATSYLVISGKSFHTKRNSGSLETWYQPSFKATSLSLLEKIIGTRVLVSLFKCSPWIDFDRLWLLRPCEPGRVAQSVGHLTRKSGVLGSIPGLATYFRFSFRFFKKGSCQLLAKVCARSTG